MALDDVNRHLPSFRTVDAFNASGRFTERFPKISAGQSDSWTMAPNPPLILNEAPQFFVTRCDLIDGAR
jgi:hypothetical protein